MSTKQIEPLADYPVVITVPVQWGDQDAFGHVNNTVPIRWFESARIVYLLEIGFEALEPGEGVGPILASVNCNYRRQIKYPDTVSIGARVTRLGRSSMTIEHCVVSQSQQATAVEGDTVLVAFDYGAQQSTAVSDEIRAAINKLEGRSV